MREPLVFIIPTFSNPDQLIAAVQSIIYSSAFYPVEVIIVNNGSADIKVGVKNVKVIKTGENLGWESGLKEGLKHTNSKYVVFCNDDIYIPRASGRNFRDMIRMMDMNPNIGAMGPASNVVMGFQNMLVDPQMHSFPVPFLIGFCMLVRREALDKIGGIDDSAPGGDDIDLSIRLKDAGYDLVCYKAAFVFHYGFQTGNKVHGGPDKPMGWNSPAMTERTTDWLIRKHGFLKWWKTMIQSGMVGLQKASDKESDIEGEMVKKYIKPGLIVELGVGAKKTVPEAIGVDEVAKGEKIYLLSNAVSVADIQADVTEKLPFDDSSVDTVIARHILEHCVPTIKVLRDWKRILKIGGRLIIAVPDEEITETIPLNPEHVVSFTPDSLKDLVEVVGFKFVEGKKHFNGISFVLACEKII